MPRVSGCDAVYEVADQWRDQCLVSDGSLLWSDREIWFESNVESLGKVLGMDNQPADSKDFFVRTMGRLPGGATDQAALFAEATIIWSLPLSIYSLERKVGWLETILSQAQLPPSPLEPLIQDAFHCKVNLGEGVRSRHAYRRSNQMRAILLFSRRVKELNADPSDYAECKSLFAAVTKEVPFSADAEHSILHLLFPNDYEAITSGKSRREIVSAFPEYQVENDIDASLRAIRSGLVEQGASNNFSFYDEGIRQLWERPENDVANGTAEAYSEAADDSETQRFWKISPGSDATKWKRFADESVIAVGWTGSPDLRQTGAASEAALATYLKDFPDFKSKNYALSHAARQLWMFLHEMEVGDRVIAYGAGKVRGYGRIAGPYEFEPNEDGYSHVRACSWISTSAQGISNLPSELVEKLQQNTTIVELSAEEFAKITGQLAPSGDSKTELGRHTNLETRLIDEIETLLRVKKQIILEGPPGSGKTYVARLFARYLAGVGLDDVATDRVEIVQFHQSYGYEDFVAGIRPVTSASGQLTYRSEPGIFLDMCERAAARPDETFVLIIDEINRGNLSRIFGELLYGLEYRDQAIRLQTPVELDGRVIVHLRIPDNLYLIGTMNSTDRSLAMIDYALRRRFYFWRLMPAENGQAPVFRKWLEAQTELTADTRARLHDAFVTLNNAIVEALGEDYQIGHSYFMLPDGEIGDPAAWERVWRHAIEPLLREYFHTRSNAGTTIESLRTGFFRMQEAIDSPAETTDSEQ